MATDSIGPESARWTHMALRVKDIDATIGFYTDFTPMELIDKREDDMGYGAWLGHTDSPDKPFILVVAQFFPETDPFKGRPTGMYLPRSPTSASSCRTAATSTPLPSAPRPRASSPCHPPTCRSRSDTSAWSPIPTATWSSSPTTSACTTRCGSSPPDPASDRRELPLFVLLPRHRHDLEPRRRRVRQPPSQSARWRVDGHR